MTWNIHKEGPFLVLICGGRNYQNRENIKVVIQTIHERKPNLMILQGGAKGADSLAKSVAKELGIPCITVEANWEIYGKTAGPLRNRWMAALSPKLVLGFHKNISESKGTKDMLEVAEELGIKNARYS